jgi:hypothetical protein
MLTVIFDLQDVELMSTTSVTRGNINKEIYQPEKKKCLWQPCLLTDRNEMSILNRGPSIDSCYQDSVDMAQWI